MYITVSLIYMIRIHAYLLLYRYVYNVACLHGFIIMNSYLQIICEFDVVFIMEVKNSLTESDFKDDLNRFLKSQHNKDSGKLAK